MTEDDAMLLNLLALCEASIGIIKTRKLEGRAGEKREYYCNMALKGIKGLDATIDGYLPDDFIDASSTFHKIVEKELKLLLEGFKWENDYEQVRVD